MEKVYVTNNYGISIVKCCASCRFKSLFNEHYRTCDLDKGKVKPNGLCMSWQMQPKLDNAGRGGGHIRRGEYLLDVLKHGGASEYFVREWERKHGSRFYNH